MGLARYWGIPERMNRGLIKAHTLLTEALNRHYGWSMYQTTRNHALMGYTFLLTYLGSVATLVADTSGKLDNLDKLVLSIASLLFVAPAAWNMHKNYSEASLAEVREQALVSRRAREAFDVEEESMRDQGVPEAKWYALSLPAWPLLTAAYAYLNALKIYDPRIITMFLSSIK